MKLIKTLTCLTLFLNAACFANINDTEYAEVIICLPSYEKITLQINPHDTFDDICKQAELIMGSDNHHKKTIVFNYEANTASKILFRDYNLKISKKEKQDIAFIVTTLGRSSLKKIWDAESSLKKAGDRVDHVHPLRFISCIFSDEELKVGLLQVRERTGLISKKFFNGLYDSLTAEADLDNLRIEYIQDFAANLNIDSNAIVGPIQQRDWKGLIDTLIILLPRSGNPNRYDM